MHTVVGVVLNTLCEVQNWLLLVSTNNNEALCTACSGPAAQPGDVFA